MQTSVAVFLAMTVIYFGSFALPAEYSQKAVGWAAQATAGTGAVATFMVMYARKVGLGTSVLLLFAASVLSVLSAMATLACVESKKCSPTFPVHTLVFSGSVLTGVSAFTGFLLGTTIGLPLWAAIVVSIALTPIFITTVLPAVGGGVKAVVDKLA